MRLARSDRSSTLLSPRPARFPRRDSTPHAAQHSCAPLHSDAVFVLTGLGDERRRRKYARTLPHGVPVTAGALAKQVPVHRRRRRRRGLVPTVSRVCVFAPYRTTSKDGVNDTFADDDDTYRQLDRLFHPIERPSRLSGPPDPTVSPRRRTCANFIFISSSSSSKELTVIEFRRNLRRIGLYWFAPIEFN